MVSTTSRKCLTMPGHMVTIRWPDDSKSNVAADASGNYSASADVPQKSGTVEAKRANIRSG